MPDQARFHPDLSALFEKNWTFIVFFYPYDQVLHKIEAIEKIKTNFDTKGHCI